MDKAMHSSRAARLYAAATVLAAFAAPQGGVEARAQALDQGEPAATSETIVVVGQRLAYERAIDAKRDATVILDALASNELNVLPDQNLAEAISRAPGVTAFQDEGAGLYVGLRGLNQEFVNLTIDGLEPSNPSRTFDANLRGANLEAAPAGFAHKVEVIKAVTPDLDADAIAGTVNIVTRSVLDSDKNWRTLSVSGGLHEEDVPDTDVDPSGKASLSLGHAFGEARKLGLVIDGSIRRVNRDNVKPRAWFGAMNGGAGLPQEVGGFFYEREEDSDSLAAKLEFRPTSALQGYISAIYQDSNVNIQKNKHALFGAVSSVSAGTFTSAQGTARNDDIDYGVDDSVTLVGVLDWFVTEKDTISVKGSSASATAYQDDARVDWFYGGPLSGTYERVGGSYVYTLNPTSYENFVDPSRYSFNGYRRLQQEQEKDVHALRLDWAHAAPNARGLGFKVGAKWKETAIDSREEYFRWRNPVSGVDFRPYLGASSYNLPGTNNDRVVIGDIASLRHFAEGLGQSSFTRREGYKNAQDFDVKESVWASYGLLDFSSEKLRVIGGVRYEDTSTESRTRLNRVDNAAFVTRESGYGDWLPSIAVTYFIRDDLLTRIGASRTLGRPDILDLARGETTPNSNGVYSRGNPDLEARRSTNLDLSVEYYFDQGASVISVALFDKKISDEIFTLQTPYVFTNSFGAQVNSYFTQPVNAGDASVHGVELGLVKNRFETLPGPLKNLGFSLNATFANGSLDVVDSQGKITRSVRPEGLSRFLSNATLFYEGPRVSARIAHRFVSRQTQSLSVDGSSDLIVDDYQQTDLSFGYKMTSNLKATFDVWNAFEDEQTFTNENLVTGVPGYFEDVRYGRAAWLGLSFNF